MRNKEHRGELNTNQQQILHHTQDSAGFENQHDNMYQQNEWTFTSTRERRHVDVLCFNMAVPSGDHHHFMRASQRDTRVTSVKPDCTGPCLVLLHHFQVLHSSPAWWPIAKSTGIKGLCWSWVNWLKHKGFNLMILAVVLTARELIPLIPHQSRPPLPRWPKKLGSLVT